MKQVIIDLYEKFDDNSDNEVARLLFLELAGTGWKNHGEIFDTDSDLRAYWEIRYG